MEHLQSICHGARDRIKFVLVSGRILMYFVNHPSEPDSLVAVLVCPWADASKANGAKAQNCGSAAFGLMTGHTLGLMAQGPRSQQLLEGKPP